VRHRKRIEELYVPEKNQNRKRVVPVIVNSKKASPEIKIRKAGHIAPLWW
jgi:hypothetical protein